MTSDIFDGPQAVELDDLPGGCEQVLLDQRTLPLGDVQIDAQVADACGNDTTVTVNAEADAGANAIIVDPADGATILVVDDDDDQAAGCQFDLQAISTGLDGAAEVEVCTSVEGGSQSELCGQRYVANAAPCVLNEDASNIRCPISLTDGVHDLIIAARFGDRITSEEISVRADCTAPSVTSVTVDEAGDSCVNRAERANPGSAGDQAAVTVSVVVDGVEDGQELALRARPDARFLGTIAINGGEGQLVINLQPGEHALYVTGRDEAGNNLPSEPLVEAIIRVDTVVAAPQILNLVADACLNAAMDEDAGGAAGLQYTIQLQPGGEVDEVVTSALRVDGGEIGNNTGAEALLEVTATLAEGAHDVSATVTDECGNVGQVAATAFRVDTIAPTLVIDAPSEGQTFAEGDDANADPNDGFQVAARVTPSELEDGQEVRLFSGNSRLGTDPARLLASGAALDATLTLSPGPHSLTARATDTCGNASTSEAVNVTVEIDGCTSRLTSFASEPQVYGPGDGVVDGQSLRIDVTAEVDLLDLNCANGTATLLLDGAPLGAGVLVDDGQIQMSGVAIPHGEHTLALRVDLDGTQTLSANQTVVVDLESPAASITAPTGDVTQDTNLGEDGQQVAVRVEVTEGSIDSARTAQLYINGAESGAPVAVGAGSPAIVSFNNTTIPAGSVTLRVCVTDEAGNEGCDEEIINADPSAPGGLTLNVTITDARRTAIQLDFTAPGDDGAGGGPVTAYELRRSDAPITDANWAAAEVLTRFTQGLVDPGQAQTLDYEGLALNEMHHLGLRAFDDLDRGGPVASGEADLSLNEVVFQLDGPDGWDVNNLGNNQSAIQRLGSVDGDAFDDILVVATAAGVSVAGVIFGADNADDGVVTPIAVPAGIAFLSLGAGIGDVNGDGIPDFALGGLTATFDGTLVSVYLGCDTSAGCARGDIVTPDATISTTAVFPDPARFLNNIIGVGDFDGGGFNDIFLGGSLAGNGTEAFVVSGRSTQDWTGATIDLDSDASVTTLNVPGGTFTGAAAVEVDGHILLSTGQAAAAQVWRFTGPAAAAAEVIHPCPGGTPWFGSYMAGGVDLDGDGDADALVGDRNSKRIVSFEGSGAGGSQCFGMSPSLDLFGFVFDTAGDVNGDGAVDVIVTHQETATTTDAFILYNDGAGGFGQGAAIDRLPDVRLSLPADAWKLGVAGIGSFNAGSEDDFAVASPATNAIQITVYY